MKPGRIRPVDWTPYDRGAQIVGVLLFAFIGCAWAVGVMP